MKIEQLKEAWDEEYAAGDAMRRHPNKFIHFTDVRKLGVNPQKTHRDPEGIYFYPIKWFSRHGSDFQYGSQMKYYYIVDIDLRQRGVVNLNTMTQKEAMQIAQRNGWGDYLLEAFETPERYLDGNQMEEHLWKRGVIGAIFYGMADYLANKENWSWLKLFRGVRALYDIGYGIINRHEASQVIVLDKRLVDVVEFGENRERKTSRLKEVADMVLNSFGGRATFRNKKIIGEFEYDGITIDVLFDFTVQRVIISYQHNGNMVEFSNFVSFDQIQMRNEDLARDIVSFISRTLEENPPSETGETHYWNSETIREVFEAVASYGRIETSNRDGDYHMRIDENNFMIHATVNNENGDMTLYAASMNTDFEMRKIYSEFHTVDKVIDDIQSRVREDIMNLPGVMNGKFTPEQAERLVGFRGMYN